MKKAVIISSLFIVLVVVFLFDWVEKPREWILGEWYEPQYQVKAVITPDRINLSSKMRGARMYVFEYEMIEESNEIIVWRMDYPEKRYKGNYEFKGKTKLMIVPQRETLKSLSLGYAENWGSNWQKIEVR